DHMLSIQYKDGQWQAPEIIPFGELSISPANATLHYGQTVFEGMKAFRGKDGSVRIFRMQDHLNRLNDSCARMCIPPLDNENLGQALKALLNLDRKWVPQKQGNALYVRPLVFATDAGLGVRPAQSYRMLTVTPPLGAYSDEGSDPGSLATPSGDVRAVHGGSGFIKTACKCGPTLLAGQVAPRSAFSQVLWLYAK